MSPNGKWIGLALSKRKGQNRGGRDTGGHLSGIA